jgi:hypothetical protein
MTLSRLLLGLWVSRWSSTSCGLGIFVYQFPESVAASGVRVRW